MLREDFASRLQRRFLGDSVPVRVKGRRIAGLGIDNLHAIDDDLRVGLDLRRGMIGQQPARFPRLQVDDDESTPCRCR